MVLILLCVFGECVCEQYGVCWVGDFLGIIGDGEMGNGLVVWLGYGVLFRVVD